MENFFSGSNNKNDYYLKGLNLRNPIEFINELESFRYQITENAKLKLRFLETILQTKELKLIHKLSIEFYENNNRVQSAYARLHEIAKYSYVQLELFYGAYKFYILKHFNEGKKCLRIYLLNYENSNLNKVFYNNFISTKNNMVVVRISSEKEDFHKINYISNECERYLGHIDKSLIGSDLDVILPNPIKNFHKNLLDPANITGNLISKNEGFKVFANHKNNNIVPCD